MESLKGKLEGTLDQFYLPCAIFMEDNQNPDAPVAYWTSFCGCPFFRVDDDARNIHMLKKGVLNY